MKLNEINKTEEDPEVEKTESKGGTFIAIRPSTESVKRITKFMKTNKIPSKNKDLHCTLVYSGVHLPTFHDIDDKKIVPGAPATIAKFEMWNSHNTEDSKNVLVAILKCDWANNRNKEIMSTTEATTDYPNYKAHMTISYDVPDDFDVKSLEWVDGDIVFDIEYVEPLDPTD